MHSGLAANWSYNVIGDKPIANPAHFNQFQCNSYQKTKKKHFKFKKTLKIGPCPACSQCQHRAVRPVICKYCYLYETGTSC